MTRRIEVQGLSKRYQLGGVQHHQMLRERFLELIKRPFVGRKETAALWALRDVSFKADEGEVIGFVGRNGAGKSTLLKILSKITYPTMGEVKVNGRVASLLEVGTGFHDELTGRENIYLNGSILGMQKREVEQRFDAIVEFSGVKQFLDTPIKRYSSGMRLRLGFAVAAHLEPDVLIVDEVLAVGDAGFQKKCINAMEDFKNSGRTVLFVSHNLAAVENLCSRGIWIDSGQIRMDGPVREVIEAYMASYAGDSSGGVELTGAESRLGNGDIRYTKVEYLDLDQTPRVLTRSGESVLVRFHYHAKKTVRFPSFGFRLYTGMGTLVTETGNVLHGTDIPEIKPGPGFIDMEIDSLNLLPAQYHFSLWINDVANQVIYDGDARTVFEVESASLFASGRPPHSGMGIAFFPQRWKFPGNG